MAEPNEKTQSKPKQKRFNAYAFKKANDASGKKLNLIRDFNPAHLQQFSDSLTARGYDIPQQAAFIATSLQEQDENGANSRGVGGNGLLGLSESRMPLSLLGDSPDIVGKQIHHILEDATHAHSGYHPQAGNWMRQKDLNKSVGIDITSGKNAMDTFFSMPNTRMATILLNNSYIRPAGLLQSAENRAKVAENILPFFEDVEETKRNGGKLSLETIRPKARGGYKNAVQAAMQAQRDKENGIAAEYILPEVTIEQPKTRVTDNETVTYNLPEIKVVSEAKQRTSKFNPKGTYGFTGCVAGLKHALNQEFNDSSFSQEFNINGNSWDVAKGMFGQTFDYSPDSKLNMYDIVNFTRPKFKNDEEKGIPDKNQHIGYVVGFNGNVPIIRHYYKGQYHDDPIDQVSFKDDKFNVPYTPSRVSRLNFDASKSVGEGFKPKRDFWGFPSEDKVSKQANDAIKALEDIDWSKLYLTADQVKEIGYRALSAIGAESDFGNTKRSLLRNAAPGLTNIAKQILRKEFAPESKGYGSLRTEAFQNVSYSDIVNDENLTPRQKSKATYERYITPDAINIFKHGLDKTYGTLDVRKNAASYTLNNLGVREANASDNIGNTTKAIVSILNADAKRFEGGNFTQDNFNRQFNRYRGGNNNFANNKAYNYYQNFKDGKGVEGNIYSYLNAGVDAYNNFKQNLNNKLVSIIADNAKFIPPQFRALAKDVIGDKSPITNDFFSSADLNYLKDAITAYSNKKTEAGLDGRNLHLGYWDASLQYSPYSPSFDEKDSYRTVSNSRLLEPFTDKGTIWRQTLGQANAKINDNDITVTDTYDFNNHGTGKNLAHLLYKNPTPYGFFRALGTLYGSPNNHGIPVQLNLNMKNGGRLSLETTRPKARGGTVTAAMEAQRQKENRRNFGQTIDNVNTFYGGTLPEVVVTGMTKAQKDAKEARSEMEHDVYDTNGTYVGTERYPTVKGLEMQPMMDMAFIPSGAGGYELAQGVGKGLYGLSKAGYKIATRPGWLAQHVYEAKEPFGYALDNIRIMPTLKKNNKRPRC